MEAHRRESLSEGGTREVPSAAEMDGKGDSGSTEGRQAAAGGEGGQ